MSPWHAVCCGDLSSVHTPPAPLAAGWPLLLLKCSRHTPAPVPLHLLLLWPAMPFLPFKSLFKCCFLDTALENKYPRTLPSLCFLSQTLPSLPVSYSFPSLRSVTPAEHCVHKGRAMTALSMRPSQCTKYCLAPEQVLRKHFLNK